MKKLMIVTCLLLLVVMLVSCTSDRNRENNIKAFLNELYQVENTDEYEELIEKLEDYYKQKSKDQENNKVITMDKAEGEKIYEPYISKYEKYCTEEVIQALIANRDITRYEQEAYEEDCLFFVKEIALEKDKSETYYYNIYVDKKLNNGSTKMKHGKGTIRLNEDGIIMWFKITSDSELTPVPSDVRTRQ